MINNHKQDNPILYNLKKAENRTCDSVLFAKYLSQLIEHISVRINFICAVIIYFSKFLFDSFLIWLAAKA